MGNYIGTSGYYYPGWIGEFYPEGISSKDFLEYYERFFDTVELNSTFYHMPRKSTMRSLKRKLRDDFLVSVKLNRAITHIRRLKEVKDLLDMFFESVFELEKNLGVVLVQLPPSLKRNDELLVSFIETLPKDIKFAIEFRHKTWLDKQIYKILRENNIAFVATHGDNYPFLKIETAHFTYIRLHGPKELYASSYSNSELKDWANYIKSLNQKGLNTFLYFNNDFYCYAVKNALTLKKLLS
ncbi:DUF72 domain-containing protein [Caldisericum exile]|uniref:DUF72 domain-containing protein n=1 Tax=Caldisericum exile (strain DSM 21853 / NBRC 104410 / AZM16c01) TaxID=511051 RepID=A0A7U6GF29_CALEA|nr:DUF72 domain-containing protein [Caldisericum exile]BAL81205.1 hypothetical protein CSE_10790 [Caldisericum exile AZM16c01]